MNLKLHLTEAISDVLSALEFPKIYISIENPKNPNFGDFSCNIALMLSKQINQNPIKIAERIKGKLDLNPKWVSHVNVTPPGFLNFKGSIEYYQSFVNEILKKDIDFGRTSIGYNKTANVEFVSANPTGPLTVGHGRQAILGDSIANILEWHGYEVT